MTTTTYPDDDFEWREEEERDWWPSEVDAPDDGPHAASTPRRQDEAEPRVPEGEGDGEVNWSIELYGPARGVLEVAQLPTSSDTGTPLPGFLILILPAPPFGAGSDQAAFSSMIGRCRRPST